jgi:thiol-disulfide isomerase/thioredoxin
MSHRLRVGLFIVAGLAAMLAGYFASQVWRDASPAATSTALLDFALLDIDGREHWLSEWQGKTIVLNFWATWCGPCKEEMPLLLEAHRRYQEQGVRVIGIAIDTRDAVAAYAREQRITYPLLIGDEAGLPIMSRFGNSLGALPYTVILRPDGTIAAKKLGAYRGDELRSTLNSLADSNAAPPPPK